MANTKIRGVTIQIGGDTSGLNKALQDTNKQIRSTQSQLKDVEKLLKLDPTNTELLAQKQQLLSKRVEECKGKLELLKKAEESLKASGVDENSEQFQALQREIISTESDLKNATKQMDNFSASGEQVKTALDGVSEKAQTVAEKTKAISAAAAAAVTAIGGMAYKAMTTADDLNTLAAQSGLTTAEIQKFQYAADIVDVSTDDIISSLKKMRKNMDSTSTDTQEAWQKLGVATKDANGQFRDSTTVFYEVLQALSQIPNETERDIIAMQLFGKNADQLAGIIDDGGAKMRELGEAAEENGLIWTQESIDAANAVNDIVDALKADISQTILVTGAKALEALAPTIEMVVNAISKLLEWIGSLDSDTIKLIATVAAIVALISPVSSIVSMISGAMSGLITLIPTLTAVAPWAALVAAIAAVGVAIAGIVKNWDEVSAYLQAGIEKVKGFFQGIADWFTSLFTTLKERATENIQSIVDAINDALSAIQNLFSFDGTKASADISGTGKLQGLAAGGTVSAGTVMVGEAGPEILTVSGGKATVTPLTNNYNTYNQLSANPIEMSLQLDSRTLARSLYTPMLELEGMKGRSLIK